MTFFRPREILRQIQLVKRKNKIAQILFFLGKLKLNQFFGRTGSFIFPHLLQMTNRTVANFIGCNTHPFKTSRYTMKSIKGEDPASEWVVDLTLIWKKNS